MIWHLKTHVKVHEFLSNTGGTKLSVSVHSQPNSSLGSWRNGSRSKYKQILTFWHHFHWASRQLVVSSFFSFLLYENKFYVTTFYQDQCPMTMAPMCLPGLQSWEVPRKQTNFAFCIKSSPSASTLWKGQQSLIFITVLKSFPKKLKAEFGDSYLIIVFPYHTVN